MQFSAIVNIFIVTTYLNSAFTIDLKRKYLFSKNVHSCGLVSLRNEFIFWNLHGIMNTSVSCKVSEGLHVNFARDPKYS